MANVARSLKMMIAAAALLAQLLVPLASVTADVMGHAPEENESSSPACVIMIIRPNGGENLLVLAKYNITWGMNAECDQTAPVQIHYSLSGQAGPWYLITGKAEPARPFEWTVPLVATSTDAMVLVVHPGANDYSDQQFTIWNPGGPAGPCTIETVDSTGDTGQYPAMVIGSDDSIHVSYFDGGANNLRYANWTKEAGWTTRSVWPTAKGWGSSIDLDWTTGLPGISYFGDPGQVEVVQLNQTGGGWDHFTFASNLSSPRDIDTTSISFGGSAGLHLAAGSVQGKYLYWSGSRSYELGTAFNGGTGITLDVEYNQFGMPFTVFPNNERTFSFTRGTGAMMAVSNLTGAPRDGSSPSIEVHEQDHAVHVAYWDAGSWGTYHGVTYTSTDGSKDVAPWKTEVIDPDGIAPVSLALSPQGMPWIAYFGGSAGGLTYAARGATNWTIKTVDPNVTGPGPSGVGSVPVKVDSLGRGHIAYYDPVNRDLKHAICPGGGGGNATTPSPPNALTATGGKSTIRLGWQLPTTDGGAAISGYRVYRNGSLHAEINPALFWDDVQIVENVTYCYRVSARNPAGEGPPSIQACAAARGGTPFVPGPALNLAATGGVGKVDLTWDPPLSDGGSPVTRYGIRRGTSPGTATLIASVGATTAFMDDRVTSGQTYYYQVSARNSVGEGPRTAEVSATPSGSTLPPQVVTTSPADSATDVLLAAKVTVTFDMGMRATETTAAFTIVPDPDGSAKLASNVLTFTPSGGFRPDTKYTVTISVIATSLNGTVLAAPVVFSFTTVPDVVPVLKHFLSGTVKDGQGIPIAGLRVEVFEMPADLSVTVTTTDAGGAFRTSLPAGRTFTVEVTYSDGSKERSQPVLLDADKSVLFVQRGIVRQDSTGLYLGVGVIAGLAALAAAFFLWRRRRAHRARADPGVPVLPPAP